MASAENQELVEFLGRQFTEITRQFTEVARQFTAIDHRFDAMNDQFTELRLEMLGHFDEIYLRFERLEQEYYASRRFAGSKPVSPTRTAGARSWSATSPS